MEGEKFPSLRALSWSVRVRSTDDGGNEISAPLTKKERKAEVAAKSFVAVTDERITLFRQIETQ